MDVIISRRSAATLCFNIHFVMTPALGVIAAPPAPSPPGARVMSLISLIISSQSHRVALFLTVTFTVVYLPTIVLTIQNNLRVRKHKVGNASRNGALNILDVKY